jgi:flagellar biosynthetic protein FlhB
MRWRCFSSLFFEAGGILLPAFALLMGFGIAASVLQNMPSPGSRPDSAQA